MLDEIEERLILFIAYKKSINKEAEAYILESLEELHELVNTANATVCTQIIQKVESIHPGHYLGKGKIEELRELVLEQEATGVVCDEELSPIQLKNLTEMLGVKVLDRTMIILDIFAQRARSNEGKIQVELAQLKYQYSRLAGIGINLSKQGAGIGTRGLGEKKLELDKRHIRTRMDILRQEVAELEKHRNLLRARREKNEVPIVSIVGYTNAGKSTLLNALSGSDVYVKNQLFATLDPTIRKVDLPSGSEIRLIDTVGFIRNLPHHLVHAFYSTLEEARYADIILHVIDASSPHLLTHYDVVNKTLHKLQIKDIPIITVFNKIDMLEEEFKILPEMTDTIDASVNISAYRGYGLENLLGEIESILYETMRKFEICLPYSEASLLAFCHEHGEKLEEVYENEGVNLKGFIHHSKFYKVEPYLV